MVLVSSADDARAPGASKLATLVNHSSARVEKRKEGGKKRVVRYMVQGFSILAPSAFDS